MDRSNPSLQYQLYKPFRRHVFAVVRRLVRARIGHPIDQGERGMMLMCRDGF